MAQFGEERSKIAPLPFLLVTVFSIGSWIDIIGIFTQLPYMITVLPEGQGLYPIVAIIIQCSNIAPIVYTLLRRYWPRFIDERIAIYVILGGGSLGMFLLAFDYDALVQVHSKGLYSVPFYLTTLAISSLDTLSTLTFFPFMTLFPPAYMAAYFLGQSLAGLLPSLLGFVQGVNTTEVACPPFAPSPLSCVRVACTNTTVISTGRHFGTKVFFIVISAVIFLCLVSFIVLNFTKSCTRHMVRTYEEFANDKLHPEASSAEDDRNGTGTGGRRPWAVVKNYFKSLNWQSVNHLTAILWTAFICNGILLQTMSYTSLPYGAYTLVLTTNMHNVAQAITYTVLIWLVIGSNKLISAFVLLYTLVAFALLAIATLSVNHIKMPLTVGRTVLVAIYCHALLPCL